MELTCDMLAGRLSVVKTQTCGVARLSKAERAALGNYWLHLRWLRDQVVGYCRARYK